MINLIRRFKQSEIFRDSFWALTGNAIGRGLSLVAAIAIAKFLGSETFGEYGVIKSTLMTIAIFSSFGLGYTATKYIAEIQNHQNPQKIASLHKIIRIITLVFAGTIAIIVAIFAKYVAIWLDDETLAPILRWASIAVVFNALVTSQNGELGGFRAYKTIARNNVIYGIFTFTISIPSAYFGGLIGAVIALVFSLALNVIINEYCLRKLIVRSSIPIKREDVKEILKFSLPIALQESLYSITSWVGMAMVVKLSAYSQMGLYSAASQWMAVMLFIPGSLRNVALSHLSKNVSNNTVSHNITKRLLLINFVSTFIPFLIIAVFSGFIAQMYGPSFSNLPAVLNISMFTAIVCSLINVLTQEFIAHGKNWFLFVSRLFKGVILLIMTYCFITIGWSGAKSLATAVLVANSLYFIILLLNHRKLYLQ